MDLVNYNKTEYYLGKDPEELSFINNDIATNFWLSLIDFDKFDANQQIFYKSKLKQYITVGICQEKLAALLLQSTSHNLGPRMMNVSDIFMAPMVKVIVDNIKFTLLSNKENDIKRIDDIEFNEELVRGFLKLNSSDRLWFKDFNRNLFNFDEIKNDIFNETPPSFEQLTFLDCEVIINMIYMVFAWMFDIIKVNQKDSIEELRKYLENRNE